MRGVDQIGHRLAQERDLAFPHSTVGAALAADDQAKACQLCRLSAHGQVVASGIVTLEALGRTVLAMQAGWMSQPHDPHRGHQTFLSRRRDLSTSTTVNSSLQKVVGDQRRHITDTPGQDCFNRVQRSAKHLGGLDMSRHNEFKPVGHDVE